MDHFASKSASDALRISMASAVGEEKGLGMQPASRASRACATIARSQRPGQERAKPTVTESSHAAAALIASLRRENDRPARSRHTALGLERHRERLDAALGGDAVHAASLRIDAEESGGLRRGV